MDHELYIIKPISWGLILSVIILPILLIFVGLDAATAFMHSNANTICTIIGVVFIVAMTIPLFSGFHLASILAVLSDVLSASQFFYMFCNGLQNIYGMTSDGLAVFGRAIVFLIWFIYILINLILSLGASILGSLGSFGYKSTSTSSANTSDLWMDLGLSAGVSAAIGVIGWIINWMFL